jgi:hypothetical protein
VDIFVAKLLAAGGYGWNKDFGNAAPQAAYDVGSDSAGNVFVTGRFEGAVDFGGGPIASAGLGDVFVASLATATGSHQWSRGAGDAAEQIGRSLVVDSLDEVSLTGQFQGGIAFCGGPPLMSAGAHDLFVARFKGNGTCLSRLGAGSAADPNGQALAVDASRNLLLTGDFFGSMSLGGMLVSAGSNDIFAAKLAP